MILTNNQRLPEPLVRAITWSDRDREGCDYTMTELLRPPHMAQLEREHDHEITEDASDRIWMLMGSAGHEVLRRSADRKRIVEERAIVEVDGFKVGGQIDYSEADHMLWDYKFVSVYAAKDGPRDEWVQQLNGYRWMAKQYGVEIHKLVIVCIFRDWSKSKASREPDFPQSQVMTLELPIWKDEATQAFISHRIKIHEDAKAGKECWCTADDTWERPAVYAVKKPGNKRAIKLYESLALAKQHAKTAGLEIEQRPAERPRCANYCRCAPFCDQWKAFQEANKAQPELAIP